MAWTTPRTWSVGETVTASLFNAHVRDDLDILKTAIGNDGRLLGLGSANLVSLDGSLITGITGANVPASIRMLKADPVSRTGSSTTETDAMTYTLPAATLAADGDSVIIRAAGKVASGASTRTIRVYWNGSIVLTLTSTVASTGWFVEVTIQRSGAAAQTALGQAIYGTASVGLDTATPGTNTQAGRNVWDTLSATLSGTVAIKTTLQDSAAGTNVTQTAAYVWLQRTA